MILPAKESPYINIGHNSTYKGISFEVNYIKRAVYA